MDQTNSDPTELDAYSVATFCERHSISRATYYNLDRDGLAPASFKAGRRRLIARSAAEAWRRRMEAASAPGAA